MIGGSCPFMAVVVTASHVSESGRERVRGRE